MDRELKGATPPYRSRSAPPRLQLMPRDAMWVEEPEAELNAMDYTHLVWSHNWLVVGVPTALRKLRASDLPETGFPEILQDTLARSPVEPTSPRMRPLSR